MDPGQGGLDELLFQLQAQLADGRTGDGSTGRPGPRRVCVRFPYGAYTGNKRMIGNLSFEAKTPSPDAKLWVSKDNWLTKED